MEQLAELFGRRKTFSVRLPAPLLYSIAGITELVSLFGTAPPVLNIEKARDLLQQSWVCSSQKLEDHIGFRNQVSIKDGLEATIKWYKEFGWL
jgi:nucleoside-diphosphate-sugar epimerase